MNSARLQSSPSENSKVDEKFAAFCLQRATTEFADDLAKVREAKDFGNDSLPILISALKQSTSMFSQEQKNAIVSRKK